jgi:ketosteroid isomerase-like protein
MDLHELTSRHEIEQVILRLARATDRRDSEAIRACYHADAFDDHGAFQGGPAEFAAWVSQVLAMFAATQHFLAPPRIEVDGDVAHCETYCTAHHVTPPSDPEGERDSVMGLRYVDRFERRLPTPPASGDASPAGQSRRPEWRIARRTCVWDYTYIVPAGVKWPLGPEFLRGSPDRSDPSYRR